jgi:hypothetical protein
MRGRPVLTHVGPNVGYGNGALVSGPGVHDGTRIVGGAGTATLAVSRAPASSRPACGLIVQAPLVATIEGVSHGAAGLSARARFDVDGALVTCGRDDTDALRRAIGDGARLRRPVRVPAGNYLCTGSVCDLRLTPESAGSSPVIVAGDGIGATTLTAYRPGDADDMTGLFNLAGRVSDRRPAPYLGEAGGRILRLPSTDDLRPGQELFLIDEGAPVLGDSDFVVTSYAGEVARVQEVLGPQEVLCLGGLEHSYGPDAGFRVGELVDGFTLRDLSVVNPVPGSQSARARGVTARLAKNLRIERVRFERLDAAAVRLSHTVGFRVDGCEFADLQHVQTANNPYGVACADWCTAGVVTGCIGDGGCHLFTTGASPRGAAASHIVVANCVASNHSKAAFDTHPGARHITFIGNQVRASTGPGFQVRGPDSQVIEPVVSGIGPVVGHERGDLVSIGVYFAVGADRGRLRGGRISNVAYGVVIRDSSDVSVVGTRIQNAWRAGVHVRREGTYPQPRHVTVDDIEVVSSPRAAAVEFQTWDDSFRLGRIRVRDVHRGVVGARLPTRPSAATLVLGHSSDVWLISGGADIESIAGRAAAPGERLTLVFSGSATVLGSGSGNLTPAGAFTASPGGCLSLVFDGDAWRETSRSGAGRSDGAAQRVGEAAGDTGGAEALRLPQRDDDELGTRPVVAADEDQITVDQVGDV